MKNHLNTIFLIAFIFVITLFSNIETSDAALNLQLPANSLSSPVNNQNEYHIARGMRNSMIWVSGAAADSQVYAVFRKTFSLIEKPENGTLRIFADTRYMLWINGSYVERGPCRFDPRRPEYDILNVSRYLKEGKNVVAVLVHHYAIKNFTEWFLQCARMIEHAPGLVARLDIRSSHNNSLTFFTDNTWKVSTTTRYLPSPGTYSSIFDNIDCRLEKGDWTGMDFDDSMWAYAVSVDGNLWGKTYPRSIPLLRENTIIPRTIVQEKIHGIVNNSIKTLPEHLPFTMNRDHQIIIDIGHVVQGYSILDFSADEGSAIEVEYASRFFDTNRIPETVMFGMDTHPRLNRYVAKSGSQTYIGGDTYGFKYLIIRIQTGSFTIHNVKIVNRLYPLTRLGKFTSNDTLLNKIWDICVNTVEVCSEDAFVDCADRERAQWIADGYLINYPVSRVTLATADKNECYVYCDHRLLKNMLRHMGLSQLPDGRLQPMRPSNYPPNLTHGVIDDYTCLWVQALRELYDRSGDEALVYELWQTVVNAMNYFLIHRSERGLIEAMEFIYFNNPLIYKVCEGASINAYIYKSLIDAAYLGTIVNDTKNAKYFSDAAELLYQNYNKFLLDENTGSYYGSISKGQKTPPTGHAAILALYYNLVPQNKYARVLKYMNDTFEKENPFPYTYRFFLDILYRQNTPEMDERALNIIRKKWKHMIDYETQTTSEDWNGGSFIHESGTHPAYYLSSYVLGVRTEIRKNNLALIIRPRLGDLQHAEGIVLTEYGKIPVSWSKNNTNLDFQFEIPPGVTAEVSLPYSSDRVSLVVNSRNWVTGGTVDNKTVKLSGKYIQFNAPSGKYSGVIMNK